MSDPTTKQSLINYATRLIGERLNIIKFFRQNACVKHGIPLEPDVEVPTEIYVESKPQEVLVRYDEHKQNEIISKIDKLQDKLQSRQTMEQNKTTPVVTSTSLVNTPTKSENPYKKLLPYALATLGVLSGVGGTYWWMMPNKTESKQSTQDSSMEKYPLLQDLEDRQLNWPQSPTKTE